MEHCVLHVLFIIVSCLSYGTCESRSSSGNVPICSSNICDDLDNVWNIALETRQFNAIQNETVYTYAISYNPSNHCINRIINTSFIWIEILPSDYFCNQNTDSRSTNYSNTSFSWRFAINTSETLDTYKLHISLKGDMYHTSQGTYWIHNDNNTYCTHNSVNVPHICPYFDESTNRIQSGSYKTGAALIAILTHSDNIIYTASATAIIGSICITLMIVIICKHRRIKRYQHQIEDYHTEYRMKHNSVMKVEAHKSLGGGIGFHDDLNNNYNIIKGPLHNLYGRYSLTMDRDSSISLNIRGMDCNQPISYHRTQPNNSDDVSISSLCSYETETKPLRHKSAEYDDDDDDIQYKYPRGYNKVSSFDEDLEQHRYESVL